MDLLITDSVGRQTRRSLPAGSGPWTIGREAPGAAVDIPLPSPSVSRTHARLFGEGEQWFVSDTKSTAGLILEGQRLVPGAPTPWPVGSKLQVADVTLELVAAQSAPAPAVAGAPGVAQTPFSPPVEPPLAPAARPAGVLNENLRAVRDFYTLVAPYLSTFRQEIVDQFKLTGKSQASMLPGREQILNAIERKKVDWSYQLPASLDFDHFKEVLADEIVGYGPISPLLKMDEISEVMVNGPKSIFVEVKGKLYETGIEFADEEQLIAVIRRIVDAKNRHVDNASPMVDSCMDDGSRVNAVIPPLALDGSALTIRKFSKHKLTVEDLVRGGSMERRMARFLQLAVERRLNIIVSGGTGSGKTTLLNVLSHFIPENERVITVEDTAELQLNHRNRVRLEARPANVDGTGRVTIRDLVVNTLRMRPDRIVVGECRGPEALDMLQAMNTGHDGSLTTLHANNPREALSRLENMVMMAGFDLPVNVIRQQIASAVQIIVQQTRLADGSRKITSITEVTGGIENGVITMTELFTFHQTGTEASLDPVSGEKRIRLLGYHDATGAIPEHKAFTEVIQHEGLFSVSGNPAAGHTGGGR
ncbi:MAG: ATPase, T2SS/T4P/T4SS family [Candidatus Spyradenecus sp.]